MLKPETLLQIEVFDWIRTQPKIYPYAFHVPNEGKRSVVMGSILKRMGMRPGVSDIFVAIPRSKYHGLWIELKSGKNRLTPYQISFLDDMRYQGYFTELCYSSVATIECIKEYMAL